MPEHLEAHQRLLAALNISVIPETVALVPDLPVDQAIGVTTSHDGGVW